MPWECNNSDDTTQRFKSGNLGKPGRDCLPRQEDVLSTDRCAVGGDNSRSPPWRDGICFCPLAINTTAAVGSISYCGMNGGWGQQWKDSPGPPALTTAPGATLGKTHTLCLGFCTLLELDPSEAPRSRQQAVLRSKWD